jgi:hypothetical protein
MNAHRNTVIVSHMDISNIHFERRVPFNRSSSKKIFFKSNALQPKLNVQFIDSLISALLIIAFFIDDAVNYVVMKIVSLRIIKLAIRGITHTNTNQLSVCI